jgi:short-subunit dehydrogenase
VGASSGIGAAVVRHLAEGGASVVAVARRQAELEKLAAAFPGRVEPVVHDVADTAAAAALFDQACAGLGGLDLIVYAAGAMPRVGPTQFDSELDLPTLDVNLGGAIAWLNPAAARFLELRRGTIVGIGSVAGDRGRRGNPAYGASKAGLHAYLESLRNRLAAKGVTVTTAKPGFVDTEMTKGLPGLFWLISPDEAAATVLAAAARGAATVYVPARWRAVSVAVRSIPSRLFRYLPI